MRENVIDVPINNNEENDEFQNELLTQYQNEENQNHNSFCSCFFCSCTCDRNFQYGLTFFGRLLMTIYSIHGLFFIYSIIIQYILYFPGFLFQIDSGLLKFIFSIIYIAFSISCSNILVIPTYEFFTFPFIKYINPFGHFNSFIYIFNEREFDFDLNINKNSNIINYFLYSIEGIYIIGLLLTFYPGILLIKDLAKIGILIFIYSYYLILVLCYFLMFFFKILPACLCSLSCFYCNECETYSNTIIRKINSLFENSPIPDINLLSYLINPFLRNNYYTRNELNNKFEEYNPPENYYIEDIIYSLGIYIKISITIFSIIIFIIYFIKIFSDYFLSGIFFLFLFVIMSILSISLNFSFCYRNRKTFDSFLYPRIMFKKKLRYPIIVSVIRLISDLIIILISIVLLCIFLFKEDSDDVNNDFNDINPSNKVIDEDNLFLPNICHSSINNIPLYLFLPFINDAYYYSTKHALYPSRDSSLQFKKYVELFFNEDYEISVLGNLIKKPDTVKMVQYNVQNKKKKKEITILSIKGTSYRKDIYLDVQLYFSSVLLNILSSFSVLTTKDSLSFGFIEYSLSIPYRVFFRYLIIDEYLKEMQKAFIENEYTFFKNVIIVGHSLGGGLAKIFGKIMNKKAISLSGPGTNAFHSLWDYGGSSENFEISAIDLVPDMDLVPRVEVSGGTIYRIICKKGFPNCHSKHFSFCEVLIMCRHPNYEEYCKKIAKLDDDYINEIYKSSELNQK